MPWKTSSRDFLTAFRADSGRSSAHRPGRLVLLGHPVAHSLSPIFQNAALRAAGIPLTYEAIDLTESEVPPMLGDLRVVNGGGNVTIPLKPLVHDLCDGLTAMAERVGAVNTFWFDDGRLYGDNTDVGGFEAAAKGLVGPDLSDARLVVLGAGGAAAAVVAAASDWSGASALIVSRNEQRATWLANRFPDVARIERSAAAALRGATLLVNATPLGQQNNEYPLDLNLVPPSVAVLDLVYRRGGTAWVNAAKARGLRAADGLGMLLEQGALAFQRWFGIEPDRDAMNASLV
jgi:shikimate dehydrogenase